MVSTTPGDLIQHTAGCPPGCLVGCSNGFLVRASLEVAVSDRFAALERGVYQNR